jgi:hypothetical protein
MATWYKWHLGEPVDNPMVDAALTLVDELFGYELIAAGDPPDFAIFKRLETKNHLHCDLVLYFSPAAHGLAELLGAEPCEKPARAGLDLYSALDDGVWSLLFPEGG